MSEEEKKRRQGLEKLKAELIEIEEHIKEEERLQKEKTIQYTNEEIQKAKQNDNELLKCFLKIENLYKRLDEWKASGKQPDPNFKKEYLDSLVEFSRLFETSPLYDNASFKSEEAIKRFLTMTAIDSYDPRDPMWSEYLAQFLKKMGLQHLFVYRCKRCDHMWLPRGYDPRGNILLKSPPQSCARCKSKYWNLDPKRKTKHVTVNEGILKHDKLTRTQLKNMIQNVDKFTVMYANYLLQQIETIKAEREKKEKEQKQEQIVMVTNRRKKKRISSI